MVITCIHSFAFVEGSKYIQDFRAALDMRIVGKDLCVEILYLSLEPSAPFFKEAV